MRLSQIERWDLETGVLVIGFGAAGGVAAIEAHDHGSEVMVLEKMAFPGGLSAVSAGGIRVSDNADEAFRYLRAICEDRTPEDMLRVLADGMVEVPDYLRRLAALNGATIKVTPALGNYPLPGCESLAYCEVSVVPELENGDRYHATHATKNGGRLFKLLEDNVESRGIPVHYRTAAKELIVDGDGAVRGVVAESDGRMLNIRAARAVILTCGGFENDDEMKRQYLQAKPVLTGSFAGNTGDGIRMAQAAGADLWHMWHYHGPYGMKDPTGEFPFALYLKAVPMWTPGYPDSVSDLGIVDNKGKPLSQKALARMAWIVVDQDGRRFMDEYPPYPGDMGVRPFDAYDSKRQKFPRIPAHMIFDENGRKMYAMGRTAYNDPDAHFDWSADNLEEVARGIFEKADSLEELANLMNVDPGTLAKTIEDWNAHVAAGFDPDHGRQPDTMVPIDTPPYYFGRVYPVVINTQGGPRHNVRQEIVNPFGQPIPRLYAAGELGSVFGHLYVSGGNLAECVVGGWIAGREASALEAWET
ncbi:FAD-dependent oxidoreductase [Oceanibacterium hippocampi]|uniref:Fumarate reductase flavoprotein subunit n=1 Tax=Oceanibacterium hippocampi TaxID=745714 RepID=A0A1Y5TH64_9PROT|nr:FAD-dependent oxidoreductase [Oceanibacterium hippocampi]SLN63935.1 Fumarate reductase flavoprotein subunit precursor [Oceanibacterium hippocampi]